jgi:hypothetical protein
LDSAKNRISLVIDFYPYSLEVFFGKRKKARRRQSATQANEDMSRSRNEGDEMWSPELVHRIALKIASGEWAPSVASADSVLDPYIP